MQPLNAKVTLSKSGRRGAGHGEGHRRCLRSEQHFR